MGVHSGPHNQQQAGQQTDQQTTPHERTQTGQGSVPIIVDQERIGTSSPTFSVFDFRETYLQIFNDFTLWEVVTEGEHHPSRIEDVAKELLASHPMGLQIHAPLSDINIASVSEPVREAAVLEVIESFRLAAELDADPVTIHPGHISPLTREDLSIFHKQMSISLGELDLAAKEFGVRACLENMPNFIFAYCKTPSELLDTVEDTDFGLTLDLGHANTNGNIASFLDPGIVDRVVNVHLHDNLGDGDPHLTLGKGNIDHAWTVAGLEALGYRGNYIIESRNYESSVASRDYLVGIGDLQG